MDLFTVIVIIHAVGAVIGVGAATFIEVFFNKSMRDGVIDKTEGGFIHTTATLLHTGLVISIFSGLALVLLYKVNDQAYRLYDPVLWAKMSVLFILLINGLLLQARAIPLWAGSALSFVSWYYVLIMGVIVSGPPIPYGVLMFYYVITLLGGVLLLNGVRRLFGINI